MKRASTRCRRHDNLSMKDRWYEKIGREETMVVLYKALSQDYNDRKFRELRV